MKETAKPALRVNDLFLHCGAPDNQAISELYLRQCVNQLCDTIYWDRWLASLKDED